MSDNQLSLRLRSRRGMFDLDIEADIPMTGITAIFGPSGSGKTSLLRLIAGLDKPTDGRIALGGEVWTDTAHSILVPAHKRPVAFVFQDARLFAHLDVAANLAYGQSRATGKPHRFATETVIEALDLGPLLQRQPVSLSGGEAKRVALGRALLAQPRLLLLDEPMAGLDQARRAELLPYLDRALRQLDIPALYVSHAIDEVLQLSDRVLALSGGRCIATGPAESVFDSLEIGALEPESEPGSVLAGQLIDHDERLQLSRIDLAGQSIELPLLPALKPGETVRLRIRARDVAIATERPLGISIRNMLQAEILSITARQASPYADLLLAIGSGQLRARLTRASVEALQLAPGQNVLALVKSASLERAPG